MLLIVFIFFVKIAFLSCIFENKNEQDLFDEINRERKNLGISNLQIHLTLQLAAQKRCANREQLIDSYQRMISQSYKNDDWPRQEQLTKIFSDGNTKKILSPPKFSSGEIFAVGEIIYLNGFDLGNDIFPNFVLIPNLYRRNLVYIGIAQHEHQNLSARCILYGSTNNFISNHRRLLRLLYILISCGILLLSLIICSIMHDRRRARLKLEQEVLDNQQSTIAKKSMIDRRSLPPRRGGDMDRMTMARLGSMIDERPSAVHSFIQSPK